MEPGRTVNPSSSRPPWFDSMVLHHSSMATETVASAAGLCRHANLSAARLFARPVGAEAVSSNLTAQVLLSSSNGKDT